MVGHRQRHRSRQRAILFGRTTVVGENHETQQGQDDECGDEIHDATVTRVRSAGKYRLGLRVMLARHQRPGCIRAG
jgi:hypothetical protein